MKIELKTLIYKIKEIMWLMFDIAITTIITITYFIRGIFKR
jgi:hypothetical protein